MQPLTLHSFARAIVHIDADAFFASCEQAVNPTLKVSRWSPARNAALLPLSAMRQSARRKARHDHPGN